MITFVWLAKTLMRLMKTLIGLMMAFIWLVSVSVALTKPVIDSSKTNQTALRRQRMKYRSGRRSN